MQCGGFFQIYQHNKWRARKAKEAAARAAAHHQQQQAAETAVAAR
jgi:hypothetical protein